MSSIKRMFYLRRLPKLQLDQIRKYLVLANSINESSRKSFTLISDLTTLIHVGDLIKLTPQSSGTIEITELKSGKVNDALSKIVDEHQDFDNSVELITNDDRIVDITKREQAIRILKQRKRIVQAKDAIINDSGTDISTGAKVRHIEIDERAESFQNVLFEAYEEARRVGGSSFTINYCFHFGIGHLGESELSKNVASIGADYALSVTRQDHPKIEQKLQEIEDELRETVLLRKWDIIDFNLYTGCNFPFLLWGNDLEMIMELTKEEASIYAIFDPAGLSLLAEDLGMNFAWQSRKRTTESKQKFGSHNVLDFSNRSMLINHMPIGPGFFQRILCQLITPYSMLKFFERSSELR